MQLVHGDLLVGRDRDDLLGEDIQRVARDLRLLDRSLAHPLRDDGRLEEVSPELREDAALRRRVEGMAGTADALETSGDGLRRLDLDDEIDRAHVYTELE